MRRDQQSPNGQIDLAFLLCHAHPAKDDALFDALELYYAAYRWLEAWADEAAHQIATRGRVSAATRVILHAAVVSLKRWRRTVSTIPARSVRGMMAKALVVTDKTAGPL